MTVLESLLDAVVKEPQGEDRWAVLADWLEEHDDPRRAELLRLHRRLLATCCEPDSHPERASWQARIVALLAERVAPCVPRRRVALGEGVRMTFCFIPPGTFLMGSPQGEAGRRDDEPLHRVTLTSGFWLGESPVTQDQWQAVTGTNPCSRKGGDLPVAKVSWPACAAFARALGEKTGKRFRLPTEAEWECACRAGTTTAFHFGEEGATAQANPSGDFTYRDGRKSVSWRDITPVGNFPPNAWGLFDMHGNIGQWCADWHGPVAEDAIDPRGASTGTARVVRGGSWYFYPDNCRSAVRSANLPGSRYVGIGCRLVLCSD
jgi:uncharacterized protein (TIGR02996 family)